MIVVEYYRLGNSVITLAFLMQRRSRSSLRSWGLYVTVWEGRTPTTEVIYEGVFFGEKVEHITERAGALGNNYIKYYWDYLSG